MTRVTEALNFFKEPWYIDWLLREISLAFKDIGDIEKAKKFALSKLKKASDDGAEIGTKLDAIIKADPFLKNPIPKLSVEEEFCLIAYRKWLAVYQPKSITPCVRLYGEIDGIEVSGEPDLDVDDVLVDIKCAMKISLKYWVQLMLYRFLRKSKGRVAVLRLDKKTGAYEYVIKDYDENLVSVWLGLARAMVYLKGDDNDGVEL